MPQETIEIQISGRSYPLTVSPEEVQGVKDAAAAVDERISKLKSQFAVQDRIDLFAMTALQLSIRVKHLELSASVNNGSNNLSPSNTEESDDDKRAAEVVENLLLRIQSVMEG